MTVLIVLSLAAAVSAFLLWFFFGPKRAHAAVLDHDIQRATVVVDGGYMPDVIRVRQGIPLQLSFDRRETGDCSARVVFPELHLTAALPSHATTTVNLAPDHAGR